MGRFIRILGMVFEVKVNWDHVGVDLQQQADSTIQY